MSQQFFGNNMERFEQYGLFIQEVTNAFLTKYRNRKDFKEQKKNNN